MSSITKSDIQNTVMKMLKKTFLTSAILVGIIALVYVFSPTLTNAKDESIVQISTTTSSGNKLVFNGQDFIKEDSSIVRLTLDGGVATQGTSTAGSGDASKGILGYAEIPQTVLSNTKFNDIRLINSDGFEIPYFLKKGDEQVGVIEDKTVNAELSNLIVRNGKTEFTVDFGNDILPHNKLNIETKSDKFARTVTIYGSDKNLPLEDSGWGLVADNRYIYSYNDSVAGIHASSKIVQYPPSNFRFLKIVINRDKKQPNESVSVSGVTATLKGVDNDKSVLAEVKDQTNVVRSRLIETKQNATKKTTEVYTDIGSEGIVVSGVTLKIEGTNFTRKIVVQGSNLITPEASWSTLGSGEVYKINATLFQGSKLGIEVSPKRYRYIRVVIENNDNLPLEISGVDVTTRPDFIIFNNNLSAQDLSYVDMYFNSQKLKTPTYDLGGELTYGTGEQFKLFKANKVEQNPFYDPAKPVVPWTERNKWAINTGLIILALIIGGFVFVYVRKIAPTKHH